MNNLKKLSEIKRLSEKEDYKTAIAICDEILSQDPTDHATLREKSSALIGIGQVEMAVDILSSLSTSTDEPSDYFDLARANMRLGKHFDAIEALDHVIEIGGKEDFDYYLSSALFLRAFSLIEVNEKSRALDDITLLPDDMRFWVPGAGLVDTKQLRSRL